VRAENNPSKHELRTLDDSASILPNAKDNGHIRGARDAGSSHGLAGACWSVRAAVLRQYLLRF
jgi:hypothetical protein